MTISFFDGFDYYNGVGSGTGISLLSRWTVITGGTLALGAGRLAGSALRLSDNAGLRTPLLAAQTSFAVGFAHYDTHLTAATVSSSVLTLSDAAFGAQVSVGIHGTNRQVLVKVGATTVITSPTNILTVATWAYIEVFGTIANAGGTLSLYVNGVLRGTFTGDTQATANTTVNNLELRPGDTSNGAFQTWFDDLYVDSGSARVGERRSVLALPNADTADKDFLPFSGGVNFAMVDENPPVTTDYVDGVNVTDLDYYTQPGFAGLGTADAVQVIVYAQKTDASSRAIALMIKQSASEVQSADVALSTSYGRSQNLITTAPSGGGALTEAALAALQIGVKVTV